MLQNYYALTLHVCVCVCVRAEECPIINITMCDYRYCCHAVEDGRWSKLAPE